MNRIVKKGKLDIIIRKLQMEENKKLREWKSNIFYLKIAIFSSRIKRNNNNIDSIIVYIIKNHL